MNQVSEDILVCCILIFHNVLCMDAFAGEKIVERNATYLNGILKSTPFSKPLLHSHNQDLDSVDKY